MLYQGMLGLAAAGLHCRMWVNHTAAVQMHDEQLKKSGAWTWQAVGNMSTAVPSGAGVRCP